MTVSIRSIETAVPPTVIRQQEIAAIFADQPDITRLGRRLIGAVFDASAIDTRHTVIDEFPTAATPPHPGADRSPEGTSGAPPVFYDADAGTIVVSPTGQRNDVYIARSPELFVSAAASALAAAAGIDRADVTHVITVSCTGFFAPGPDHLVVRELGLSPSTQRFHLGFMGCYGAFPALRAARSFCLSEPDAVVLVVCAEVCTLHLRSSNHPDAILAASVFADGAAAAVVSARPAAFGELLLDLDALETVLTPTGEADMAWTIGGAGFEMVLSSYVPKIIERHIKEALAPLLAADPALTDLRYGSIEHWAVHPGGRSILDRVQRELQLSDDQLQPSREVLRTYGNMSSATVLFVLRAILYGAESAARERVCAMAFGPGLTVETALLTRRTVA